MSWSTHVLLVTIFLSLLSLLTINHSLVDANQRDNLVVVTVATQITEGFLRFNRSVNLYGLKLEVLGLSQQWEGGDVAHRPGGGQKILLLKKYMESVKDQKDLIVLFTDSYDVVFNGGLKEILNRFHSFESKLVFSSEKFCWPDPSLESEYPKSDGKRFLNSGAFIGYAPTVYSIVSHKNIENDDDDQLYYTKIYLDSKLREQHKIKLDLLSELFQNLNGALSDVEIRFSQANEIDETNADASLLNKLYQTNPIIVHGNGNSKIPLNSLGNYLAKSWHPATGCLSCKENRISLDNLPVEKYPHVLIAVNILKPTPFFDEWLQDLESMDYPKERITLFIQTLTDYHSTQLEQFIDDFKGYYQAIRYKSTKDLEWQLRNRYLDECPRIGCDYLFVWDTEGRLTNPKTLRALIEDNKSVVAPLMFRNNELWSNFWGALTHDGFYSRAHDYVQIIKGERRGVWNVPHISVAYLVNASVLDTENRIYNFRALSYYDEKFKDDEDVDPDMNFCRLLRQNGIFMYVDNMVEYGHLARMNTYDITRTNPDFYEIKSNEFEWRRRYIHENYTQTLESGNFEQPCPDVYWFPVASPIFCRHMIEIMENYGQWSAGKNQDPRLEGGYESVPTRDIHLTQVGLDEQWLHFLALFIRPVQEKIFIGYEHDPPRALMNFVVRYHPDEQANLRPHHDSSTYTINIALNRVNVDYKGGGCRFVRYNCSVTDPRLGWSFIHPGRLTHYHEGLTVTDGTRYIMVSFVDP